MKSMITVWINPALAHNGASRFGTVLKRGSGPSPEICPRSLQEKKKLKKTLDDGILVEGNGSSVDDPLQHVDFSQALLLGNQISEEMNTEFLYSMVHQKVLPLGTSIVA